MKFRIYVDIRCLQDPMYQFRGVGNHVSSILRSRRHGPCASCTVTGLVDDKLPPLPREFAILVDDVTHSVNPSVPSAGAVFIDSSPMTHDARFSLRFVAGFRFVNVAIIYDFIPLDWPGYLPTVASRIGYLSKAARLKNFDLYLPISEYSAWRLEEILGVRRSQIVITGASVRSSLYTIYGHQTYKSHHGNGQPYFFTVGGGDRRKNTEAAVAGVRRINAGRTGQIALKVVGHYDATYKADLLREACHHEGAGFLQFYPGVSDETLVSLYAGSIATIAPSHIEGFSFPVVESAVCGSPVIASTCGAHLELIEQPEALFQSNDHSGLYDRLESVLNAPALRQELMQAQAHIGPKFHENEVGGRFWRAVAEAVDSRRRLPFAATSARSTVAFLSPYPPDQSGVARYTQRTIEAAARHIDIDLYTDAERPIFGDRLFRDAGKVSIAALLKGKYDSIVSVIGNSHFHNAVFEVFEQYGGPCILHDSRLTHIYYVRLGKEGFLDFAARILGRPVSMGEVDQWLQDRDVPSLFVEPIIKRAEPLIVHTKQYQSLLYRRYGVRAELTTFCPNIVFAEDELRDETRRQARERLGISPDIFLVATFGYVSKVKGMDSCIVATEMLRGWNIPAELYFVGSTIGLEPEIDRIATSYGIGPYVHWSTDFVDNHRYRNFLLASDAAVQLRTYGFGQPSAALADCISAGVPGVASAELAESCDAPEYVLTVPERNSPLHLAEQLAVIWDGTRDRTSYAGARRAYMAAHNFDFYVRRLREILDLR